MFLQLLMSLTICHIVKEIQDQILLILYIYVHFFSRVYLRSIYSVFRQTSETWSFPSPQTAFGGHLLFSHLKVHIFRRRAAWSGLCIFYKTLRFYIAKYRSVEEIPREISFTIADFIVSNKQYSDSLDFTVPPSIQGICVFVQDNAAGSINRREVISVLRNQLNNLNIHSSITKILRSAVSVKPAICQQR